MSLQTGIMSCSQHVLLSETGQHGGRQQDLLVLVVQQVVFVFVQKVPLWVYVVCLFAHQYFLTVLEVESLDGSVDVFLGGRLVDPISGSVQELALWFVLAWVFLDDYGLLTLDDLPVSAFLVASLELVDVVPCLLLHFGLDGHDSCIEG